MCNQIVRFIQFSPWIFHSRSKTLHLIQYERNTFILYRKEIKDSNFDYL